LTILLLFLTSSKTNGSGYIGIAQNLGQVETIKLHGETCQLTLITVVLNVYTRLENNRLLSKIKHNLVAY